MREVVRQTVKLNTMHPVSTAGSACTAQIDAHAFPHPATGRYEAIVSEARTHHRFTDTVIHSRDAKRAPHLVHTLH